MPQNLKCGMRRASRPATSMTGQIESGRSSFTITTASRRTWRAI